MFLIRINTRRRIPHLGSRLLPRQLLPRHYLLLVAPQPVRVLHPPPQAEHPIQGVPRRHRELQSGHLDLLRSLARLLPAQPGTPARLRHHSKLPPILQVLLLPNRHQEDRSLLQHFEVKPDAFTSLLKSLANAQAVVSEGGLDY